MYGGSIMNTKNKKAFTLIEMLVVVVIIGILAAIALPQYQLAVLKSRASQGLSIINSFTTAQKSYHLIYDKYATAMEDLDITMSGFTQCYKDSVSTIYKNDKFQFRISNSIWDLGGITSNANCKVANLYNGPNIAGMAPGGYGGACPSASKDICIMCAAGIEATTSNSKQQRKVCESLGGKYVGQILYAYVYKLN
ncbi:MAG: prepilin-type N-terminal cleavage/methylation domain-containing protein [Elusimicrobiota bacterium]|jgi:prepilin-type N-terminal cleavage/methylation domain-containing protein|nr:prepilin-type N-terminal cleavage/methylation domain-containing protein [Elusimicrobiota bacterium]